MPRNGSDSIGLSPNVNPSRAAGHVFLPNSNFVIHKCTSQAVTQDNVQEEQFSRVMN